MPSLFKIQLEMDIKKALALSTYLKFTKHLFSQLQYQPPKFPVHIVMGNESADPDSIFGAISLAYLNDVSLHSPLIEQSLIENSIESYNQFISNNQQKLHIPLVQIERKNLSSRFESLWLMEQFQLNPKDLILMDDFNFTQICQSQNLDLTFTLYDHNVPQKYPEIAKKVTRIVDHHVDRTSTFFPKDQNLEKTIQLSGSATTLVMNLFLQQIKSKKFEIDERIMHLVRTVQIFDTFNFYMPLKNKRWIQEDLTIFNFLTEQITSKGEAQEYKINEKIHEEIYAVKFDVKLNHSLNLDALYFRDYKFFSYKTFGSTGYAVITLQPQQFF